jgi:DNA-binding SARP family transcriptional activator
MRDRYYKQELLKRLEMLAARLEAEGKLSKTVRDTIAYISEDNI